MFALKISGLERLLLMEGSSLTQRSKAHLSSASAHAVTEAPAGALNLPLSAASLMASWNSRPDFLASTTSLRSIGTCALALLTSYTWPLIAVQTTMLLAAAAAELAVYIDLANSPLRGLKKLLGLYNGQLRRALDGLAMAYYGTIPNGRLCWMLARRIKELSTPQTQG